MIIVRSQLKICKFVIIEAIILNKPFILITLLFCLIAPAMMTYLWLNLEKQEVKHEVKRKIIAGLDKSDLVLISLSKAEAETELEWEHSKEFEFEGEMYDVVKSEVTSDSVKYWCWWDFEETALNKNLAELVNQLFGSDPGKKQNEQNLITFYKSLFSENLFQWESIQYSQSLDSSRNYTFNLVDFISTIPTPPPQKLA